MATTSPPAPATAGASRHHRVHGGACFPPLHARACEGDGQRPADTHAHTTHAIHPLPFFAASSQSRGPAAGRVERARARPRARRGWRAARGGIGRRRKRVETETRKNTEARFFARTQLYRRETTHPTHTKPRHTNTYTHTHTHTHNTPMDDRHAWEGAKENYRPSKAGHAPAALCGDGVPLGKACNEPTGAVEGRR